MTDAKHVIFGTGPLGRSVLTELLKRGLPAAMVNTSGRRPADLPAEVEVRAANLYNPASVRSAALGAKAVYQCAQPAYHEWPAKWPPLMKSILEGLSSSGARLVLGDNLYMYGDTNGQPLHEGLPENAAHTRKGRVRGEVAEMALAAHRAGALAVTIGRGSDFYGPGVLDSLAGERVFAAVLAGKPAELVGNVDLPHTLTYIQDFGKALVILGEREEALGQAWHVPNAPTLSLRQWAALVSEAAGRPARVNVMGRAMLTIGGLFIPAAREVIEMLYEFEKPYVVDSSNFVRAFGDHSTPHREAIQATLAWYRARLNAHTPKPAGRAAVTA